MRAVTIAPRQPGSLRMDEVDEIPAGEGSILVRTLAIGVCGTDRELIEGLYGEAPPGRPRLVLGHESLGRVIDAPRQSAFSAGELVVGIVRHPDPVPCPDCALGEWDMCRNGRYTEHGIKQLDGFCAERWRSLPGFLVKVNPALGLAGVLLEPASVLAKAWEHIERIGRRSRWSPRRLLVTGAGPVGLMAALMGAQRGLEVHVLEREATGPKPGLVRELGATHHLGFPAFEPDIVIEATGSPALIAQCLAGSARASIVCLTGLGGAEHAASLDVATLNQSMVLENRVVFGSVNANRRHYEAAAQALERADRGWLQRMLARKVPLEHWEQAYEKRPHDVKTVLCFAD
ncbi:MAG: glucose 1-dehydrogenase [Geminicoccales bacterium]